MRNIFLLILGMLHFSAYGAEMTAREKSFEPEYTLFFMGDLIFSGEIKSVKQAAEYKAWIPHKVTAGAEKVFRGISPSGPVEITLINSNATVVPKVGDKYLYVLRETKVVGKFDELFSCPTSKENCKAFIRQSESLTVDGINRDSVVKRAELMWIKDLEALKQKCDAYSSKRKQGCLKRYDVLKKRFDERVRE